MTLLIIIIMPSGSASTSRTAATSADPESHSGPAEGTSTPMDGVELEMDQPDLAANPWTAAAAGIPEAEAVGSSASATEDASVAADAIDSDDDAENSTNADTEPMRKPPSEQYRFPVAERPRGSADVWVCPGDDSPRRC